MELSELLTELRENILYDRSDRISGTSDYLWTDATLVRYIDQAQRRLAREALLIRDGVTPEVTQVTLRAGVTHYALHESVLAVLSAKVSGDQYDLKRATHNVLDQYRPPTEHFFDVNSVSALTPGKPVAFTTDDYLSNDDMASMGVVTMRVYPEPSAAQDGDVLNLRVIRMPINRLSTNDMCAVPEVAEEFHMPMLDWAGYLALRVDDIDAGSERKAENYKREFDRLVFDARRATMRKLRAPQGWAFGRNGFAWGK